MKSYTVLLNSSSFYNRPFINNNGIITYAIDWNSILEPKPYKVSFSFASLGSNAITSANLIQVFANFSGSATTFQATDQVNSQYSDFLGVVKPQMVSANNDLRLVADANDNVGIYLASRPTNNFLTITLRSVNGATYALANANSYLLTLRFEEI
jgi:hypothetical protein